MYSVILLNGGIGSRVKSDVPKQLIRLQGTPIFIYSLRIFDQLDEVDQVVVNYPSGWKFEIEELVHKYAIKKPVVYVEAGASRQESVCRMLECVSNDRVLIHEAARPLVDKKDFNELISSDLENVTFAQQLPFSVLKVESSIDRVAGVLDREKIINVQLPQKFITKDLKDAHEQAIAAGKAYTEDAAMVFDSGKSVSVLIGNEKNFKITNNTDVVVAEHIIAGDLELVNE